MSTAQIADANPALASSRWSEWLAYAGAMACVAGIVAQGTWQVLPAGRFAESLLIAAITAALAWPLKSWRGWSWASAISAVGLAALALFAGPVPMVAAIVFGMAAFALGSVFADAGDALPVGLAICAGALGWLLPLPVHHQATYLVACAGLILWRRRALVDACGVLRARWSAATADAPVAARWGMLALVVASTGCWLPTLQFDDLAYHLGLPWQLQLHGEYALDPEHQAWALAPWAGDVLHGVVQVLAGTEARGAWNLVWLLLGAAGAHRLAGALGAGVPARWSAVALHASLPLSAALAGGMQTELAAAAVMLALACLVQEGTDQWRRSLLLGALLFGLLCALKPMHALTALPLVAWAAWRHRQTWTWRWLPLAATALLAVGASSYAYAWVVSGNPFLPLFNATFASPYFPLEDFNDSRWQAGLDGGVFWTLTFDTARYFEGWSGAFGFVLVALSGAWCLALLHVRTRALAIAASAGLLLTLVPLQYARYLYPALVLLVPVLVAAMDVTLPKRAVVFLLAAVCVLNFAFQANANWMQRTGAVKDVVLALGDDAPLLAQYAPERVLIATMRDVGEGAVGRDGGRVLALGTHPGAWAELGPRGRNVTAHAPRMQARALHAERQADGSGWATLIREERATALLLRPEALSAPQRAALVLVGATRMRTVGDAELWHVPGERGL